jgi:hypothetical protein
LQGGTEAPKINPPTTDKSSAFTTFHPPKAFQGRQQMSRLTASVNAQLATRNFFWAKALPAQLPKNLMPALHFCTAHKLTER